MDGGSSRNSMAETEEGVGRSTKAEGIDLVPGERGDRVQGVDVQQEPIYVNSAFGASLKTELSCNDRIIPPPINNNNNSSDTDKENASRNSVKRLSSCQQHTNRNRDSSCHIVHNDKLDNQHTYTRIHSVTNGTLPRNIHKVSSIAKDSSHKVTSSPPLSAVAVVGPSYHTLPSRRSRHKSSEVTQKHSELTVPRKGYKSRRRSSDKQQDLSRHQQILNSAFDLLTLRLDPFPLLEDLGVAGVLTTGDVDAFRGHPDRRLIVESLISVIGHGDYNQFTTFIQV